MSNRRQAQGVPSASRGAGYVLWKRHGVAFLAEDARIMSLEAGQFLGPYRVARLIGEGGMGQVWQATDTQLGREVALKILPDAFAADPDRLARFQREAQILASLNHTNIAAIYGIEEAPSTQSASWGLTGSGHVDSAQGKQASTRALVLELVEGPTLADRIAQGAIPIEDALPIARQIAEALEAAHERGVIHRDLKPANIKVKADGAVKVLDFGLAKAVDPMSDSDQSQTPTLTGTQMGVIMGTTAYMSPEQARGKLVDKRSDVWAFGVVLYEMLSGTRAFAGGDKYETLAYVIVKDIDWAALPKNTPATVRHLMQRCLERDPRQRLRDIGEARIGLEGTGSGVGAVADDPTAPSVRQGHRPTLRRRPVRTALLGAASLLLAVVLGTWVSWPLVPGWILGRTGLGEVPVNPPLPDRPSIVVLRFADLSPDPSQAYLAEGLAEDLSTHLSTIPDLLVISRSSAWTYQDRPLNIEQVGRELGVRYVLGGSVRTGGGRVRVNVQLTDTTTGFQVWGQHYDRTMSDVILLQSDVSEEILGVLSVELADAELDRIRRKPTDDLTAYEAFVQGQSLFARFRKEENDRARQFLQTAIALDPAYAKAHALLAGTYNVEYGWFWNRDPETLERALQAAQRALELDPFLAEGHRVVAAVYWLRGDAQRALGVVDRAVELRPNDELARALRGSILVGLGRPLEAFEDIRAAQRLNPKAPSAVWIVLAIVNSLTGRVSEAVALLEELRIANPDMLSGEAVLVDLYVSQGELEKARSVVTDMLRVNPALTQESFGEWMEDAHPRGARVLRNLRLAGLP